MGKTIGYISTNLVGRLVIAISGFTALPLLLHSLGEGNFSKWVVVNILIMFVAMLDFGISKSGVRFICISEKDGNLDAVYSTLFVLTFISSLFVLLLGISLEKLSSLLPNSMLGAFRDEYMVIALMASALIFKGMFISVFFAAQKYLVFNTLNALCEVLKWISMIFVAMKTSSLIFVFYVQVASLWFFSISAASYLCLTKKWDFRVQKFSFQWANEILRFSLQISYADIFQKISIYFDKIVLAMFVTPSVLNGYYMASQVTMRLNEIPSNISSVFYTNFSRLYAQNDLDKIEKEFLKSIKTILMFSLPFMIIIQLMAKHLFRLWLGPDYFLEEILVVARILTLGSLFAILTIPGNHLLNVMGKPNYVVRLNIYNVLFLFVISIPSTYFFGATGLVISWSICQAFIFYMVVNGIKHCGISANGVFSDGKLWFSLCLLVLFCTFNFDGMIWSTTMIVLVAFLLGSATLLSFSEARGIIKNLYASKCSNSDL